MIVYGTIIANQLLSDLSSIVKKMKVRQIDPKLAVIHVGHDSSSLSYINQKKKAAKMIGVCVDIYQFSASVSYQILSHCISKLGKDQSVHGIIIQRPLPPTISETSLTRQIPLGKDVDGFKVKSPYQPPIGKAVLAILASIYWGNGTRYILLTKDIMRNLVILLKKKKILLIGRGETAGKPIAKTLSDLNIRFIIATSQTPLEHFAPEADIIISAVGKKHIVTPALAKSKAVLISVGLWKNKSGRLCGDYDEDDVRPIASYFTPTPGGVGPVNVACLMQNVVHAASIKK